MEERIEAPPIWLIEEAQRYTDDAAGAERLAEKTWNETEKRFGHAGAQDKALVRAQLCLTYAAWKKEEKADETVQMDLPAGKGKLPFRLYEFPGEAWQDKRRNSQDPREEELDRLAEQTEYDPEKTTLWIAPPSGTGGHMRRIERESENDAKEEEAEEKRSPRHAVLNTLLLLATIAAFCFMVRQSGILALLPHRGG